MNDQRTVEVDSQSVWITYCIAYFPTLSAIMYPTYSVFCSRTPAGGCYCPLLARNCAVQLCNNCMLCMQVEQNHLGRSQFRRSICCGLTLRFQETSVHCRIQLNNNCFREKDNKIIYCQKRG